MASKKLQHFLSHDSPRAQTVHWDAGCKGRGERAGSDGRGVVGRGVWRVIVPHGRPSNARHPGDGRHVAVEGGRQRAGVERRRRRRVDRRPTGRRHVDKVLLERPRRLGLTGVQRRRVPENIRRVGVRVGGTQIGRRRSKHKSRRLRPVRCHIRAPLHRCPVIIIIIIIIIVLGKQ